MTVLEPGVDGRTARGQRTRRAVADALLALIHEGDLRPTAPRIAERAGVSLRSIFQHYSDLETLFAAAGRRHLEQVQELIGDPVDPSRPRAERVDGFVAQRARVLEFMAPVARAAAIQEPFSTQLRANREWAVVAGRAEIETVFAVELSACPASDRTELLTALEVATSSPTWEQLRVWHDLSPERARAVMVRALAALLQQTD